MNTAEYYHNIFGVSVQELQTLIAAALSKGGDYADLYFEYTTFFNLNLKDGVVSSGGFHTDCGVGIRVLKGERTGYAYSENLAMDQMLKAAQAASIIAQSDGSARTYANADNSRNDYYRMEKNWRDIGADAFLPFLQNLEKAIFARDSRVVKVIARLSNSVADIMMYNSLGELTYDTRPMGSVSATAVFQQDGKTENKSSARSFRVGAELIGDSLAQEIAREITTGIDQRFEAVRPKGGQMSVVMGAGASGILHKAYGRGIQTQQPYDNLCYPPLYRRVAERMDEDHYGLREKSQEGVF
jgi:TldD protein